jgi:hypothetical protein
MLFFLHDLWIAPLLIFSNIIMGGGSASCKSPCGYEYQPYGPPRCVCPSEVGASADECNPPCHRDPLNSVCYCSPSDSLEQHRRPPSLEKHHSENQTPIPLSVWILLGGALILACYLMSSKRSRR